MRRLKTPAKSAGKQMAGGGVLRGSSSTLFTCSNEKSGHTAISSPDSLPFVFYRESGWTPSQHLGQSRSSDTCQVVCNRRLVTCILIGAGVILAAFPTPKGWYSTGATGTILLCNARLLDFRIVFLSISSVTSNSRYCATEATRARGA